MIPLVDHPAYNITALGLERLHPFDSRKYRRIHWPLVHATRRGAEEIVFGTRDEVGRLRRTHDLIIAVLTLTSLPEDRGWEIPANRPEDGRPAEGPGISKAVTRVSLRFVPANLGAS